MKLIIIAASYSHFKKYVSKLFPHLVHTTRNSQYFICVVDETDLDYVRSIERNQFIIYHSGSAKLFEITKNLRECIEIKIEERE